MQIEPTHTTIDAGPLLLVKEVEQLTRLTKPTIYKLMRKNAFPRQVRVGEYKVAWYRTEVDAWIQNLASQRPHHPNHK